MPNDLAGFRNPWFQIGFGALLVTASELFLKYGATRSVQVSAAWSWTGLAGLSSAYVWIGIVFVIASFVSWLYVLRHIPLTVAFPLSQVVHITVPLCCWTVLHEQISARRWAGIALVLCGLLVIAKPIARIEERL